MKHKKLILSLVAGATIAGIAIYLLGTDSGKKELKRLKKTGSATAGTFTTVSKEVARNVRQARNEERNKALKAFVLEAMQP